MKSNRDGVLYPFDLVEKKRVARLNNNMLRGSKLRFLSFILVA